MPHRRVFRDVLSLISHFLQSTPDYASAPQIAVAIGADQAEVETHLSVLRTMKQLEEMESKEGVKLVRWKRDVSQTSGRQS